MAIITRPRSGVTGHPKAAPRVTVCSLHFPAAADRESVNHAKSRVAERSVALASVVSGTFGRHYSRRNAPFASNQTRGDAIVGRVLAATTKPEGIGA